MDRLWLDLETYNETDIGVGTYRYAETASILLFAWAIDDEPAQVWDVASGAPMPPELGEALVLAPEVWAHNAMFDRTILRAVMPELTPGIERWRCTMVQAYMHGLPGSLDTLCDVFGLPQDQAKLKDGKRLVQLFCKPLPKSRKIRRATATTHPGEWARFVEYARNDIVAMRELHRRMPRWNYPMNDSELTLWHLDQAINDRGVAVDRELARGALAAVAQAQEQMAQQVRAATSGVVESATQRDALLEYMASHYGIILDDLQGHTIDKALANDLIPEPVKELLRVRAQVSSTSTAKYQTLIDAANSDGRLRGLLQFSGAARTSRWSGRVFQPQNLPRPQHKQKEIDAAIEKFRSGQKPDGDSIPLAVSAIRGCLVAPATRKLVIADLSNIEGRMLAWLAGEGWKIKAFADFDTVLAKDGNWLTGPQYRERVLSGDIPELELDDKGEPIRKGHDLYKLAYAASFGVKPEEVTKDQRQVGKVQELALGYAGGVGAFVTFAAGYGIDLVALGKKILAAADPELVKQARDFLAFVKRNKGSTYGLDDDTFVACDTAKRAWRNGHPNIVQWWRELEDGFRSAVGVEGQWFDAARVRLRRVKRWTLIRLPSGRFLCYPDARLSDDGKQTITFAGTEQWSRKWSRITTYAGKLAENVTQAASRDILAAAIPSVERHGYAVVLSVHDELITETPDAAEYNAETLAALMASNPPWADGLPLAAAGFETYRYRKD